MKVDEVMRSYPEMIGSLSRRDLMKYASAGAMLATGAGFLTATASAQEPTPGGVWSVTLAGNPTAYPITAPGGINDVLVNKTLYNCLTQYTLEDGAIQVVGDLAESWEVNEDLSQYTFTLKPGVTWHDGTPLTAADVVFTIESMLNPDVTASQRGNIALRREKKNMFSGPAAPAPPPRSDMWVLDSPSGVLSAGCAHAQNPSQINTTPLCPPRCAAARRPRSAARSPAQSRTAARPGWPRP